VRKSSQHRRRRIQWRHERDSNSGRDGKTGQFVTGSNGGPGRRVGSRNRLGEQFVEDLRTAWNEYGVEALRRCAEEEPAAFVKVIANLLPKTLDINMTASVDAVSFAEKFRHALSMLHSEPQPMRTIESADARQRR
jgi:hypothetical protein